MDFAAKAAFLRVSLDSDSDEEVGEEELIEGLGGGGGGGEVEEEKAPSKAAAKAKTIGVQMKTKKKLPDFESDQPVVAEEAKEVVGGGKKSNSQRFQMKMVKAAPVASAKAMVKAVAKVPSKPVPVPIPAQQKPRPAIAPRPSKKWKQEVDTNVVEIPLSAISSETAVSTGDPVFCEDCRALLNACSVLEQASEPGRYTWPCEFCGCVNQVTLEIEEIPRDKKLKYIVESAGASAEQRQGGNDTTSVIFCIDVSGSMCVTQPAKGNLKLKTKKDDEELRRLQQEFGEGEQFVPGEARNRTYISRLECVQAAIDAQIQDLLLATPERHVGLVTFNEEVTIYGDSSSEVIISGDRLNSVEGITGAVRGRHAQLMGRSVRETNEKLVEKVFSLRESGQTALGPALLASVELAKQGAAGSKVIICTDGIANIGLGSLESHSHVSLSQQFYSDLARSAQDSQVTISVVSIAGEECQLSSLLPIVEMTGGSVAKVDPQHLAEDFSNILAAKLIGSAVNVTVLLHKALKFRNVDESANVEQKGSRMVRRMGNVTESDLLIFEYTFKTQSERDSELIDISHITEVPFQVRIEYTSLDGSKCVFAHTEKQPITTNKKEAMQQANFEILAKNGQVRSAALAQGGDYEKAMVNAKVWNKALVKNSVSSSQKSSVQNYVKQSHQLYQAMQEEKFHEVEEGEEEDELGMPSVEKKMKRVSKAKDVVTVQAYKMKKKS